MTGSDHSRNIAIIVHGGAGDIPEEHKVAAEAGCRDAAAAGWQLLSEGRSALDAVEAAVRVLEDNPAFNAGRGSVLNAQGEVEMDAGVMDGATLLAGAVTLVQHFKHPITLARKVMEKTPHHILGAGGAEAFAEEMGCEPVANDFFITERRLRQFQARLQAETADTVGAVALDFSGNLAAANSTGGVSFKLPGRIGDSPLPGAGFYADNRFGAVATTGQGEHIMRAGLGFLVMRLLEMGFDAQEAADQAVKLFQNRVSNGRAGWIVLDAAGNVGVTHTTKNISYAWRTRATENYISGVEKNS